MRWFAPLLFPFSILYDAITSIRNRLYNTGVKPVARFDVPVLSVGNLSVGGTGKTPMIEYLIRLLSGDYKVATLSRGYGRKTRGMRIAAAGDNASTIGDEPFQFFRKFGDKVAVAVGEDRAFAIPHILQERPQTDLLLLDDAFQHRRVLPSFQILLTDYHNLFVSDYLLPAGRLRESKRGADRADVVLVTKCPGTMTDDEMITIEGSIRKYTKKPVFFTRICYGNVLPATDTAPYKFEKVVVVSGIANPAPLIEYLKRHYEIVRHFNFRDHHAYSGQDLQEICSASARSGAVVVTTEKDVVKMDPKIFREGGVSLYYLPIEVEFVKNGKEFDEMVLNAARTHAG
jgi:tetraacyldisaccharide 4'-kinase